MPRSGSRVRVSFSALRGSRKVASFRFMYKVCFYVGYLVHRICLRQRCGNDWVFKVCGIKSHLVQRGHRAGTKTALFVPGGMLEHAGGNVFAGFCSQRKTLNDSTDSAVKVRWLYLPAVLEILRVLAILQTTIWLTKMSHFYQHQ